ncbi:MAG TPA: isochorismate synthase, partial [Solirubrobacterales bacterium]|nr:isochorismate synthase [Solirubrobacterales bacterium]
MSVTARVDGIDPSAAVFASRLATDRWFCWEQPDREFALAALGVVHEACSRGTSRFEDVARECLGVETVADEPPGLPAGAGATWVGGFAFDPEGGSSSAWSSLAPASLVLPELSICRSGGETFLTLNAEVRPGDDPERKAASMEARLTALRMDPMPFLDPHPTERVEIRSVRPPGDFERMIARATERIRAGEMSKVVLAREVLASAGAAHDPAAVFGGMRDQFP